MARGRIFWGVLLRAAMVFAAAFELFGCAAPAFTVATVAADGASLAASGKTLGDHALSAMSGKDCSTLDFIDTGVMCRPRPDPAVPVEHEVPPLASAPPPPPPPAVDNSAATFLALGAFPDWETADKAVVYGRDYVPLIVPLDGEKGKAFWVVAGHPLAGGDNSQPIAQAKKLGFKDARTMELCRATYRPGPCESEEPAVAAADSNLGVASGGTADATGDAMIDDTIDAKIAAARRPGKSVAQRPETRIDWRPKTSIDWRPGPGTEAAGAAAELY